MTQQRFEVLATRFEKLSRRAPRAYRTAIALLASLGYAYVFAWLLASAGVLALLALASVRAPGLLKLAIPVALFTWVLLRALWVRIARPEGLAVTSATAPALFAEIARLRRMGRVPRIHRVLVNSELNASVAQVPRLGILGWPHNDLIIGLPLLLALSPDGFRAVLAHELGHLSGRHGRMGAWIYRVRLTWLQVVAALDARRSRFAGVFRAFFRWYGPFFGAATFALAREQEREADRFSAAAAGTRAAGDALVAVALADAIVDQRFWPMLQCRTIAEPEPPAAHLALLEQTVRAAMAEPAATAELERQLLPRTRGGDTHPSLSDRLAALGEPARVPPSFEASAAAHFLGSALPGICEELEARWRDGAREAWEAAHAEAATSAARLKELDSIASSVALGAEQEWERVTLTERLSGAEAAQPLAASLVARHPAHAPVHFALGRMLLADGRDDGMAHLERAISLDPDAELPGARLIAQHLLSRGRDEAAAPWLARAERLGEFQERAAAERSRVLVTDRIEPHGLPPPDVEAIVAPLRGHPEIARLLLARKRLEHMPERAPVFVLGVIPRRPWYRLFRVRDDARLAQAVADSVAGPWRVVVFVKQSSSRRIFRRMQRLKGARVV